MGRKGIPLVKRLNRGDKYSFSLKISAAPARYPELSPHFGGLTIHKARKGFGMAG